MEFMNAFESMKNGFVVRDEYRSGECLIMNRDFDEVWKDYQNNWNGRY